MKIALANVKYSPNLGDGLIAECFEWALRDCLPGTDIVSVDLAGRRGFAPGGGTGRGRALALLAGLPQPLRQLAITTALRFLVGTKYKPAWRSELSGSDLVILGGGQLLADADLNFPIKIRALAGLCGDLGSPSAVFGVGVSKKWGAEGARLFRAAMRDLQPAYIAVRDEASVENWRAHFEGLNLPEAQLCRDPGLLAGMVYPATNRPSRPRPRVGLGIVHPHTLNLHGHGAPLSNARAIEVWTALARELMSAGFDVSLFTNGPPDDESFAAQISGVLGASDRLTHLPRPHTPAELVVNIGACDAIVAHRLHANIAAFALKRAHVGIGWDAKLPSFMASVGRGDYMVDDIQDLPPGHLADLVQRAINDPVPEERYDAIIAETLSGIRACAEALVNRAGS